MVLFLNFPQASMAKTVPCDKKIKTKTNLSCRPSCWRTSCSETVSFRGGSQREASGAVRFLSAAAGVAVVLIVLLGDSHHVCQSALERSPEIT